MDSLIQVPDILAKYQILSKVYQGSISAVYQVQLKETGQNYAIKIILKYNLSDHSQNNYYEQELITTKTMIQIGNHENIVNTLELIEGEEISYIITEFCEFADLLGLLQYQTELSTQIALSYSISIAKGLQFLHSNSIFHRDLKPENILVAQGIDEEFLIKIADFGISKQQETSLLMNSIVGTVNYMSPEQIKQQKYFGEKVDIWGLGCIIFEICTNRQLFFGCTPSEVSSKILQFEDFEFSDSTKYPDLDPVAIPVLNDCLRIRQEDRKPLEVILKSLQSVYNNGCQNKIEKVQDAELISSIEFSLDSCLAVTNPGLIKHSSELIQAIEIKEEKGEESPQQLLRSLVIKRKSSLSNSESIILSQKYPNNNSSVSIKKSASLLSRSGSASLDSTPFLAASNRLSGEFPAPVALFDSERIDASKKDLKNSKVEEIEEENDTDFYDDKNINDLLGWGKGGEWAMKDVNIQISSNFIQSEPQYIYSQEHEQLTFTQQQGINPEDEPEFIHKSDVEESYQQETNNNIADDAQILQNQNNINWLTGKMKGVKTSNHLIQFQDISSSQNISSEENDMKTSQIKEIYVPGKRSSLSNSNKIWSYSLNKSNRSNENQNQTIKDSLSSNNSGSNVNSNKFQLKSSIGSVKLNYDYQNSQWNVLTDFLAQHTIKDDVFDNDKREQEILFSIQTIDKYVLSVNCVKFKGVKLGYMLEFYAFILDAISFSFKNPGQKQHNPLFKYFNSIIAEWKYLQNIIGNLANDVRLFTFMKILIYKLVNESNNSKEQTELQEQKKQKINLLRELSKSQSFRFQLQIFGNLFQQFGRLLPQIQPVFLQSPYDLIQIKTLISKKINFIINSIDGSYFVCDEK